MTMTRTRKTLFAMVLPMTLGLAIGCDTTSKDNKVVPESPPVKPGEVNPQPPTDVHNPSAPPLNPENKPADAKPPMETKPGDAPAETKPQ